jgi:hypothetical protein
MSSTAFKPVSECRSANRFQKAVTYFAEEWAAPLIAWTVVSGIVLAVVCLLFLRLRNDFTHWRTPSSYQFGGME